MAIKTKYGADLKFYDDWPFDNGRLFVYGHEFGPIGVIRAKTWEDAYEIAHDEFLEPISDEEVKEILEDNPDGDEGLPEGYYFQANSTGFRHRERGLLRMA